MKGARSSVDSGLASGFRRASRMAAVAIVGLGAIVLAGWALDIAALTSVHASLVSMKANTALGFVMLGSAVLLAQPADASPRRLLLARSLACATSALGLITLLQYGAGIDLGIDEMLVRDEPLATATAWPGRMSPLTALHFLVLGAALLLPDSDSDRRRSRPAEWLVVLVGLSSLLAVLGYAYRVDQLVAPRPSVHTAIALHTAVGFLLACAAIAFARPQEGVMRLVSSATPAGALVRATLPAAILLPFLLGWIRTQGERSGLFGAQTGLAVFAAANMVCFGGLILWSAYALQRADSARRRAERAIDQSLRESEARKAAVLEASLDCIVTMDHTGAIVEFNQAAERTFGYERAGAIGRQLGELLVPPGLRERHARGLERYVSGAQPTILGKRVELSAMRSDGSEFPAEVTVVRIRSDGDPMFTGYIRDITERHRSAAALRASEARFRRLVESGLIGIAVADAAGEICDASDSFLAMLGRSRAELERGQLRWGDLAPPRWHELEQAASEPLGQLASAPPHELELRRADGSQLPVLLGVTRLDETSTIAFVLDLTERKQAEAAIRDLQRERAADVVFRALLEAAPDAMVILDRDGRIALVNSEAERMFGYARAEMLGQPVDLLLSGGRFEPNTRAGTSLVMRGRRKDGSEFPIEVSSSPIETEGGPLLSTAIRDITQRVDAEERLRRAKEEAEIAMGELEAFSYSVAHDLRAPLRSINGFSSAIMEDWGDRLDEHARDYLNRIVGGAERMGHLIDALLTLARVSRIGVRRELVDLTQLATAIFAFMRASQPERSVEFVVHPGLEVQGDPQLLRVLLENLIGNAWKFSSRREHAHIEFGCARDDGDVYYVSDDGAGFDMRFVNKLFTPFQRLHASSEFPGTGIGLATVQRIVRRHGGRIWAESAVDRGATFHFTLSGAGGT
jgi:PAS domain S-box-containing protein